MVFEDNLCVGPLSKAYSLEYVNFNQVCHVVMFLSTLPWDIWTTWELIVTSHSSLQDQQEARIIFVRKNNLKLIKK